MEERMPDTKNHRPDIFTSRSPTDAETTIYISGRGVTTYVTLGEDEVRDLIRRLQSDLDAMPRVASAADLGIAA
jgi:hypothetical protein